MKTVWRTAGIVMLAFGFIWIVSVMGGVFSHTPGFTTLSELWPALAFHTVSMMIGMFCMGKSYGLRPAVQAPAGPRTAVTPKA